MLKYRSLYTWKETYINAQMHSQETTSWFIVEGLFGGVFLTNMGLFIHGKRPI